MKRVISYPLLFTIAIILDRVAISSTQMEFSQSLRTLLTLFILTIVATFTIQYFVKDWQRTHFMVLMIPVAFIAYRPLFDLLKTNFPDQANDLGIALILLFGMLYIVVVRRKVWASFRNPTRVTYYFNLVFIFLLFFQVIRLGGGGYNLLANMSDPKPTAILAFDHGLQLKNGSNPDIYVIVLDGYARQDVLQNIYGEDNSEFIDGLTKRGFYVASDSHSNYTMTAYAMASLWNLEHIQPCSSHFRITLFFTPWMSSATQQSVSMEN